MYKIPVTLKTDAYKLGHASMYPPDMNLAVGYFSFRRGLSPTRSKIRFLGLPELLRESGLFSGEVEGYAAIEQTTYAIHDSYFCTLEEGWAYAREIFLRNLSKHGRLWPVDIYALPNANIVHPNQPIFQVVATGENARLLTYFESLLMKVWYPSTVATIAGYAKQIVMEALNATGCSYEMTPYMVHDFGYRGCATEEQARIGGQAHLLEFSGTDNMPAGLGNTKATSVYATEHSVMQAWGKDREAEAILHIMDTLGTDFVLSTVADTWDYENFCKNVLPVILPEAAKRKVKIVVRPDSGDKVQAVLMGLNYLARYNGYTSNSRGYKVLNNCGVIQGDGISDVDEIRNLYSAIADEGYAATNLVVGMGGGLLQKVNRDTLSAAFKLSNVNGAPVWKQPVGDKGKHSLPGPVIYRDDGTTEIVEDIRRLGECARMELVVKEGILSREYCDTDVYYPPIPSFEDYPELKQTK